MNFENLTIKTAREGLDKKDFSSRELTEYYLGVIKEKDPEIHAFLNVFEKGALTMADEADQMIATDASQPLTGIPLAIKDNILIKNSRATAGSKILENYIAAYDATVTKRLRAQGAVFLGKTNLDEFAMGSSTENSAFGPTKNPLDLTRTSGGSSGGSAAAVASGMALGALGSDTGGSIRQPASFCGLAGLKPTYGSVSRYGLVALASSFDQIGPLAKTVRDAEIIYGAIAGRDELDSNTLNKPSAPDRTFNIKELAIGIPKEYFAAEGLDKKVKEKVEKAVKWFGEQGAKLKEISLASSPAGLATYYILMPAEASANLARYDGVRYGFSAPDEGLWQQYRASRGLGLGPEPRRRSMIGTYVLSAGYYDAYYKQAKVVQALIREDFEKAFSEVDLIMTPTSPTVAFLLGERVQNPLEMYAADIFTVPLNIAGLPGLSVPCGDVENLPVGLQIIAPWQQEANLFATGKFFEENYVAESK